MIDFFITKKEKKHFKIAFILSLIFILIIMFGTIFDFNLMYASITSILLLVLLIMASFKEKKHIAISTIFYITTVVFIFGRHISYILSFGDADILWVQVFANIYLNEQQFIILTYVLLFSILMIYTGELIGSIFANNMWSYKHKLYSDNKISFFVMLYLCLNLLLIVIVFINYLYYIKQFGYVGFYLAQEYLKDNIFVTLNRYVQLFLGVVFSYSFVIKNNQKEAKLIILLIIINGFLMLLLGQRGLFLVALLCLLFFYSRNNNVSIFKLLLFSFFCIFLSQIVNILRGSSAGIENDGSVIISILSVFSDFFYSQGISISTILLSINNGIEHSGWINFFTFMPLGTKFVVNTFSTFPLDVSFFSYAHALASSINPILYENGQGMGWSIFGSFYWIFGMYFSIPLFSLIFGIIIGVSESEKSPLFIKFLFYSVMMQIIFSPRAEIFTITSVIYIALFFYGIMKVKIR